MVTETVFPSATERSVTVLQSLERKYKTVLYDYSIINNPWRYPNRGTNTTFVAIFLNLWTMVVGSINSF